MIRSANPDEAHILTRISFESKGFWLEHLFIDPRHIGNGIGSKLFSHLRDRCKEMGRSELGILADPNSRGFYEKMGWRYIKEIPSNIKNRTTPYLRLQL